MLAYPKVVIDASRNMIRYSASFRLKVRQILKALLKLVDAPRPLRIRFVQRNNPPNRKSELSSTTWTGSRSSLMVLAIFNRYVSCTEKLLILLRTLLTVTDDPCQQTMNGYYYIYLQAVAFQLIYFKEMRRKLI